MPDRPRRPLSPEERDAEDAARFVGEQLDAQRALAGRLPIENLYHAQDEDPDRVARVRKIQQLTGVPFVDDRSGELEQRERAQELLYKRAIVDGNPAFARFLEDPMNAKLAVDDLPHLERISNLYEVSKVGFQKGLAVTELGRLGHRALSGEQLTPAEMDRVRYLKSFLSDDDGRFTYEDVFSNFFEIVGQMGASSVEAGKLGVAGAIGGAAVAGVGAIPGFFGGLSAGFAAESFKIEAGHAYLDYLDIQGPTGDRLDRDTAAGAAVVAGLANAILETAGFGGILKGLGADRAVSASIRKQVRQILVQPTTRAALTEAGKSVLRTWGPEVATEVVQELIQAGTGELAKVIDGGEYQYMQPSDYAKLVADIAIKVGTGMIPIAAAGPATRIHSDIRAAQRAQTAQELFTALGAEVPRSKLFTRDAQKFGEFVDRVTENGPKEAVYVEAEKFAQYFQSAGVELTDLAQELPSLQAQMEKFDVGGDIVIPMGEFASKVAPTQHLAGLQPHLRLNENDLSSAEVTELAELNKEFYQQMVQSATESVEQATPKQASTYPQIYRQLRETYGLDPGVAEANAQLIASFYDRTVNRGVSQRVVEKLLPQFARGDAPVTSAQATAESFTQGTPVDLSSITRTETFFNENGEEVTVELTGEMIAAENAQRQEALGTLLNCLSL